MNKINDVYAIGDNTVTIANGVMTLSGNGRIYSETLATPENAIRMLDRLWFEYSSMRPTLLATELCELENIINRHFRTNINISDVYIEAMLKQQKQGGYRNGNGKPILTFAVNNEMQNLSERS